MELMWLVYGISVLSNIGMMAIIMLVLTVLGAGFALFVWAASDGIVKIPYPKTLIALGISAIMIVIVVPREKTMYTMAGAYATQKVAEAPATKEVADKVLKIINEKLDSMVKK